MTSANANNPPQRRDADDDQPRGSAAGAGHAAWGERSHADLPAGMPREIDGYKLLHVIGSGGMATVYAALQERPRRTVALKVMKAEVDDEVAVRRFRREVEILGKLRHQYIAQVFSAGTYNDGQHERPYFAMEYVADARTIFEYAAMENLSVRDRVKLFVHVCAAIEHGNANRIVHRDLKPSNILVDRRGRPKIIDFGVARVTELQVGLDTANTEMGRLVGTFQYMSPEQVSAEVSDLDGRSDVYALGVLLCKLLTGKPPYELDGLPVYEAARVIREDQPDRPSAFNPQLKGDLDTIILKALEKSPARRYKSAGEFGRDLVRWLENKPIHARPASVAYRARLFFARHRAAVLSVLLSTIVISASAGVVLFVLLNETERQRVLQQQYDDLVRERAAVQDQMISSTAIRGDEQAQQEERTRVLSPPVLLESPSGTVHAMAFLPQKPRNLITGTAGHDVVVWDIEEEQTTLTFVEHDTAITHVSVAGGLVATAAGDRSIAIDNSASGAFVSRIPVDCENLRAMAFSDDTELLAWSCDNLSVHVQRLGLPSTPQLFRSSRGQLEAIAFSADSTRIAAGSERGSVFVWDAQRNQQIARMDDLQSPVIGLTFDESGRHVIAVSEDGRMVLWRLEPDAGAEGDAGSFDVVRIAEVEVHRDGADAFAVNGSRTYCAVSTGVRVQRYDLRDLGEALLSIGEPLMMPADVISMAIRIDGRMLVTSHEGGQMTVQHVRSEG